MGAGLRSGSGRKAAPRGRCLTSQRPHLLAAVSFAEVRTSAVARFVRRTEPDTLFRPPGGSNPVFPGAVRPAATMPSRKEMRKRHAALRRYRPFFQSSCVPMCAFFYAEKETSVMPLRFPMGYGWNFGCTAIPEDTSKSREGCSCRHRAAMCATPWWRRTWVQLPNKFECLRRSIRRCSARIGKRPTRVNSESARWISRELKLESEYQSTVVLSTRCRLL